MREQKAGGSGLQPATAAPDRGLKPTPTTVHSIVGLIGLVALAFAPPCPAADPVVVKIEGLPEPLEKNVRALLTLAGETADATPERIHLAEDRAPKEIRAALEPFGYYRPKIETAAVARRDDNWQAEYRIDPGPPIKLTAVDVRLFGEAANTPEMRALAEKFPLKPGDTLDHTLYEKGKSALQDQAAELGFFDARLTAHEILVDLDPYAAQIHLRLESGRRYRFGPISFNETPLDADLPRRYLHFAPGDPYRASAVLALQKSLLGSGYFSQVDVTPKPEQAKDNTAPVRVDLGMAPRNRYDVGAGYGTDTGPRLSLGYRNRYVNGYGHTFQANARLSLIWNELNAVYAIPLADPEKDQLAFTAKSGFEDTVAGRAKVIRAGVRHSTTRWGLRETLALDFLRENFTIAGVNQTTHLLIPGVNYIWLSSDDPIYPDQGFRLDGTLSGAWEGLGSDASLIRLRINAKGVYSFDADDRLIARAQWGELATNDFDRLPLSQRFYAGGDQSVRGYRLNEISPVNGFGQRVGGQHLMVGSLEYNRTVYGDWGMAVFADVGHVYNKLSEPLKLGVGAGVRWRSPVGPVRLDIGVPLSSALDVVQVHLVLGPDL
ncbi:autotransporter assembly complex protein TamA [Methylomagnum sp.]